jgi:ribosomal protein L15
MAGLLPRIGPTTSIPKTAPTTGSALKETGRRIGESALDAPISFAGTEIASGFGAGLAFGATAEVTEDPSLQFLGGIFGGVLPSVALKIMKMTGFTGFRLLNDARMSFMKVKGEPRAADRLNRDLIYDDEAINFKDENILEDFAHRQSPAQQTSNKALLSIERAILESDDVSAALKEEGNTRLGDLNEIIIRSFDAEEGSRGDFVATLSELRTQQAYMKSLWKQRQEIAAARAKKRIKEAGGKINKQQTQKIVNEEIQSALDDAIETQKELWELVDKNVTIDVQPLLDEWIKLISDRTRIASQNDLLFSGKGSDDLLRELGTMISGIKGEGFVFGVTEKGKFVPGRLRGKVSLRFLQDLRSRLLDDIRSIREPSDNKKRIFNRLQKMILNMYKTLESDIITINPDGSFTPPDQRTLNAIQFTREMNQNFNQGPLAAVLAKNKQGGYIVDPTLTLNKLLGSGLSPEERTVNMTALKTALRREAKAVDKAKRIGTEDDLDSLRPVMKATEAYLQHSFVEEFVDPNGRIMVDKANAWFRENREFFKLFDDAFKQKFRDAIDADAPLTLVQDQASTIKGVMANKERAAAVRFLTEEPIKIFDNVIGKFNDSVVRKDMKILVRQTKRDKSGEALKGFQQSVLDWILERSMLTGDAGLTAYDTNFISGKRMTDFLKQKQVQVIIEEVLSPAQQNRLRLIHNSARKLDLFRNSKASAEGIIADNPAWILDFLGRVGGAQVGRQVAGHLGGGTVQTPGAFASRTTILLKSVTQDHAKTALIEAFTASSPERLRALLMLAKTPKQRQIQTEQLNAWFTELIMRYNLDFEDEQ